MLALLALLLTPVAQAQAPCPAPASVAELSALLDQAESAYAGLDPEGFTDALDEATLVLPCVVGAVSPDTAARVHRLKGIALFVADRRDDAAKSFAAARRVDPDYVFPETLVPPEHDLRTLYVAVDPGTFTWEEVPPPETGVLRFDGLDELRRPTSWPTIAQLLEGSRPTATAYVRPGDPLPAYTPAPTRRAGEGSARNLTWLVVGGSALALSGAAAGAALAQGSAMDSAQSRAQLDAAFARQKGFAATSYSLLGLGALGVGLHFAL